MMHCRGSGPIPLRRWAIAAAARNARDGFGLVRVIAAVAVLALLAGLVIPAIAGVTGDAETSKVLTVADTLEQAVERHLAHTLALATESSNSIADTAHELSMRQPTTGWRGPYLDHPLSKSDNPFGHDVLLYESFDAGGTAAPMGFDLLGPQQGVVAGAGQYVQFLGVPEDAAQRVDSVLDRGISGSWAATGRVEYSAKQLALNIYLIDR